MYAIIFAASLLINGISSSDVIVLDEANFEHLTQLNSGATTGDWFVKFYAPWCGHCKRLAPVWEEVATEVKGQVNIAKVDVTQNRALGKQFNVKGFPTLLLFRRGKMVKYSGSRTKDALAKWAISAEATDALPGPTIPLEDRIIAHSNHISPPSTGNYYGPSDAFSGVQQNWMEQLVNHAALSDVSFIIGNERMKMHGIKALLANISPVLKQQLYDGANGDDNSEQCIEYLDISPNAFTSIIRGSLGINPNINDENVREVMKASQLLQIDDLVTECQRYNSDKVKQRVKHVIVPGLLIVEGAFSHASVYNDIIWISGTIAAYVDEDGTNRLIDGGVKEQTVAILESIEKILNRSGSSFEYITNLRIFIDNNTSERYKEMNQAYVEFFQSRNVDVCARITVGAKGLALGADVEIDGSAVVP